MDEFRLITKEALTERLQSRSHYQFDQAGYLIEQAEYLLTITIKDEELFKNLIACTWVTKDGESPRTLDATTTRIMAEYGSLERLAKSHPCHKSSWYERIIYLRDNFCWRLIGPLFVTPIKGSRQKGENHGNELEATPAASFAIVNGLHCSLAAMWRMKFDDEQFQSVEAVLVLPRVDY